MQLLSLVMAWLLSKDGELLIRLFSAAVPLLALVLGCYAIHVIARRDRGTKNDE